MGEMVVKNMKNTSYSEISSDCQAVIKTDLQSFIQFNNLRQFNISEIKTIFCWYISRCNDMVNLF